MAFFKDESATHVDRCNDPEGCLDSDSTFFDPVKVVKIVLQRFFSANILRKGWSKPKILIYPAFPCFLLSC